MEVTPADATSRARVHDSRWLALLILCLGDLMIVLDVQTEERVAEPAPCSAFSVGKRGFPEQQLEHA